MCIYILCAYIHVCNIYIPDREITRMLAPRHHIIHEQIFDTRGWLSYAPPARSITCMPAFDPGIYMCTYDTPPLPMAQLNLARYFFRHTAPPPRIPLLFLPYAREGEIVPY